MGINLNPPAEPDFSGIFKLGMKADSPCMATFFIHIKQEGITMNNSPEQHKKVRKKKYPNPGVLLLFFFFLQWIPISQAGTYFGDNNSAYTGNFPVLAAPGKVVDTTAQSEQWPEDDPMTYDVDARAALGTASALIDRYLQHALTSLRLIAGNPATRSGIWPEIRPGLLTLRKAIPGAVLYIEPDGGYYSVDEGYTGLNLSDRDYFNALFSGEEIHGSLIYSRSTGKQSVLMAVPVYEGEEVTGAVAISIFLDDFQQLISDALNLDDDYLWYVLDQEGTTVLHPRTDFVFMNPTAEGSPSLRHAVETILDRSHGYTSYIFAGRNTHILFTQVPFNDWRVILGKIGERSDDHYMPEASEILVNLKETLAGELSRMDQELDEAVASFNGQIPAEHVVRDTFRRLYQDNPYIVKCALIDAEGVRMHVEPSEFHPSEGSHIRNQEDYFLMQKNKAPMLSSSFLSAEGFDAVSLQHPIIDGDGEFHGSVSLLIRPDVMVEELATPYIAETMYEPWIMEPEGRIIFDKALEGTGRMLFLDYRDEGPQSLLELGDAIAEKSQGAGDYIYRHPEDDHRMVRMAIWDTIHLHDARWRVIISYAPY